MPIFVVAGQVGKHDSWNTSPNVMLPPAIDAAANQAEAVGRMIIKLQKEYPTSDGWQHTVQATEVPLTWLSKALEYEKSRGGT